MISCSASRPAAIRGDIFVPPPRKDTELKKKRTAFVYLLLCADGTVYTGWTLDIARRFETHQKGHGARYTRSRRP
ncbi:MAG: GIY-YIG nuclease family protein, partial [Acidobacteriota bacterium]